MVIFQVSHPFANSDVDITQATNGDSHRSGHNNQLLSAGYPSEKNRYSNYSTLGGFKPKSCWQPFTNNHRLNVTTLGSNDSNLQLGLYM